MTGTAIDRFADFVTTGAVPPEARAIAAAAYLDTIGVMLAGAVEPAALAVQAAARSEGNGGQCRIVGTPESAGLSWAALANGTAAHALDYDDMCFVSLAHPSAPLVAAALAAGELADANGRTLLDAWVVGFEIECILGRAMNPRHYTQGWHCTSTLGTIGAAAAAARILGLDHDAAAWCLAVAASEASGLKENFGTDTKPLHAGLAARNGVVAALLAKNGLTASTRAIDGPQGFMAALGSERTDLGNSIEDLGKRWEACETGVTVKLYPSCAGTHPALDAILDLKRQHGFTDSEVDSIAVGVDQVTPTILLYDRPVSGLEGKFSMQFCAAAAVITGGVGLETFEPQILNDQRVRDLLPRITMTVDSTLRADAPTLTQSRVTVRLKSGPTLTAYADGARGYPAKPASDQELNTKFRTCAERVLNRNVIDRAFDLTRSLDTLRDIHTLTESLSPRR